MKMRRLRTGGVFVVGVGVEVEMRTGIGVRVEMFCRRRVGVSLSPRREVEERRRWGKSRRVEILVEEAVKRKADGVERVKISGMGFREGKTLSYGFVEGGAAVTA